MTNAIGPNPSVFDRLLTIKDVDDVKDVSRLLLIQSGLDLAPDQDEVFSVRKHRLDVSDVLSNLYVLLVRIGVDEVDVIVHAFLLCHQQSEAWMVLNVIVSLCDVYKCCGMKVKES